MQKNKRVQIAVFIVIAISLIAIDEYFRRTIGNKSLMPNTTIEQVVLRVPGMD